MANKQVNELTTVSGILSDSDYKLVYDASETGSEKLKKLAMNNSMVFINSNTTIYVATTGSDTTGDGSSGSPFATLNGAMRWLDNKFISPNALVTIDVANGTYSNHPNMTFIHPQINRIKIEGDTSTPSNVTLQFASNTNAFTFEFGVNLYTLAGIKLYNSGTCTVGMRVSRNSSIWMYDVEIDNFQYGANVLTSSLFHGTRVSVTNASTHGIRASSGSTVHISSATANNNGTAFYALDGSTIILSSPSLSGNSTDYSPSSNTEGNGNSYITVT